MGFQEFMMNMAIKPKVVHELLDKITILQIKSERIADSAKVANVRTELDMLRKLAATDRA